MNFRSIKLLLIFLTLSFLAGCSGNSKAGVDGTINADGGDGRSPETAACVETQRKWVLDHVSPEQRQDVEATIRALLQDRGALSSMPVCSGQ